MAELNQRTMADIEAARESAISEIESRQKMAAEAQSAAVTNHSPSSSSEESDELSLGSLPTSKAVVASTRSSQLGWLAHLESEGSPSDLKIDPNVVRDSLRKTLAAERRIAAARDGAQYRQ